MNKAKSLNKKTKPDKRDVGIVDSGYSNNDSEIADDADALKFDDKVAWFLQVEVHSAMDSDHIWEDYHFPWTILNNWPLLANPHRE